MFQKGYLKTQATPGSIELINWNSNNFSELKEAIKNSDVVINLIGILYETRKQKFRDLGKFFPREAVIDFTITGSKKDCIKKIEKYVDKGVKHFVLFHYFSPDPVKAMEVYSKEIIPYFNS